MVNHLQRASVAEGLHVLLCDVPDCFLARDIFAEVPIPTSILVKLIALRRCVIYIVGGKPGLACLRPGHRGSDLGQPGRHSPCRT